MTLKNWNIEELTGYKPITTFYTDFSIADLYGSIAIKDTYKRGLKDAAFMGYKELTEFVMVLNWKIWEHYKTAPVIAELYQDLWEKAQAYVHKHLKGDELSYYYRTLD